MIETMRIVKDNHAGYAIINRADFDPKRHEAYDAEPGDGGPTVKEIRARLGELGVSIPRGADKAAMLELLAEAERE